MSKPTTNARKILVVDDKPQNVYLLESLITSAGCKVISACNGFDALESLRREPVDAIVSDILMPRMDGFQLIRECKLDASLRDIPFIFYTGTYTDKKDEEFAFSLGAVRYIIKPEEPLNILKEIKSVFKEGQSSCLLSIHQTSPRIEDEKEFLKYYSQTLAKKLEEKVRDPERTNELFHSVFENSVTGITLDGLEGKFLKVNDAFVRMIGYTNDYLEGIDQFQITYKDDIIVHKSAVRDLLRGTTEDSVFNKRFIKKNGQILWASLSVRLVRDDDKDPLFFVTQVQNITLQREAEETLKRNSKKYLALFENISDPVIVYSIDQTGKPRAIYEVNDAACKMFRYKRSEIISIGITKILTEIPEERQPQSIDSENFQVLYETEGICKDGFVIPLSIHASAFEIDAQRMRIINVRDLTESKYNNGLILAKNEELISYNEELIQIQNELRSKLDELATSEQEIKRALREKEVLISEIHHRVKNNLTAFISLLSLEVSDDTPSTRELKDDLKNRARSMALVHETLYRTKRYDNIELRVYLTMLVDQIAKSYNVNSSIRVVIDIQDVVLDIYRATPAGLIVNEIITNSIKHAFPESFNTQMIRGGPPTIHVSLTKSNDNYTLTVKDNGVGMNPDITLENSRSVGFNLINVLTSHQMQGTIELHTEEGTEYIIRF